jgi:arylformamidase
MPSPFPSPWFDLTRPVVSGQIGYPGDPPPQLHELTSIAAEGYRLTTLTTVLHAGTHLDAPAHFISGGATVDTLGLHQLLGWAVVISVPPGPIAVEPLIDALAQISGVVPHTPIGGNARMLFIKSGSTPPAHLQLAWMTESGLDYLMTQGITVLGTDQLDLEAPPQGSTPATYPCHRRLLGAGVLLLEDLDLAPLPSGIYECLVMPLRLAGAEAAPARVLARAR